MSNFDEWFKSEMPNTYSKKDSEKIEALVYSVAFAAWNVQQAKLDRIEKFCIDDIRDYQQSEKSAFAEHGRGYFNACCQVLSILKGESK